MNLNRNLKKLSGDASFRKFYRDKFNKKILVISKSEKKNNLLIYDAINKLLIEKKIKAPKLINENFENNYIEIEDLGDLSILKILKRKKNKINFYNKIILLLIKFQKIKKRQIQTFKNTKYVIPFYTKKKLFDESKLFIDWYIKNIIPRKKQKKLKLKIIYIIKKLLKRIKGKNNTLVHRDFHISNMMFYKNDIALIDTQDAVYGNIAYDLASLIDDVRFNTSQDEKKKIFKKYIDLNKIIKLTEFKNDFDILSVLRNLKIIGIFTRLSIRDNKKKYLKLIPNAWRLIEMRMQNNNIFLELKSVLDYYFSKKIRNKKWK